MKKIFCLVFVVSIFCFASLNTNFSDYIFSISSDAEVSFFVSKFQDLNGTEIIKNGDGFVLNCTADFAEKNFNKIKGCYGFSIKTKYDPKILNRILNDAKVVSTAIVQNIKNYYCSLAGVPFSTIIDGKKINFQIAVNNQSIIVGSPIILGSY